MSERELDPFMRLSEFIASIHDLETEPAGNNPEEVDGLAIELKKRAQELLDFTGEELGDTGQEEVPEDKE